VAVKRLAASLGLSVLLVALVLPGGATAAVPGFIDQYQEPFPTGGGNQHQGGGGGTGSSGGSGTQLPASTQAELANSVPVPVAEALESVATSPDLGAPQQTFADKLGSGSQRADASEAAAATSLPDALTASAEAESPYLLAVLLALAATALAGAAALVVRRRRASARPD
jgi:hypothetical protein